MPLPASDDVEHDGDAHLERSPWMFDPWLTTKLEMVARNADTLVAIYASLPRRRRLKDRDREHLHLILRAILANLAYAVASEAEPLSVGFSLRTAKQKLTRYDRAGFTTLPAILKTFPEQGGPWSLRKSNRKGTGSAIIPTPAFVETLRPFRLSPEHFAQERQGRETIVLRRTKRDYVADTAAMELIEYDDTPETEGYL